MKNHIIRLYVYDMKKSVLIKIGLVLLLIAFVIDKIYDVTFLRYFYSTFLWCAIIFAFVSRFRKYGIVNESKNLLRLIFRKIIIIFISVSLVYFLFFR